MNFEYSSDSQKKVESLDEKLKEILKFMMRDITVESYMKTFDKIKCEHVIQDTDKNTVVHCLIKMALIETHDLIA